MVLFRRKFQTDSPSSSRPPQRKGIAFVAGLLPTIFVIAISFGLGTTILVWLITHQASEFQRGAGAAFRNGTFIVDEGGANGKEGDSASMLRVLTFSALASHLISLTSSFLMTLAAYRSAAQWLANSEQGQEGKPNSTSLTPLQYGLASDLLDTSSLPGVWRALRYTLRKPSKRAALPRILIEAFATALTVLILTHAVGVVDLWLHTTSRAVLAPLRSLPVRAAQTDNRGVAFNQTLCDSYTNKTPEDANLCFPHDTFWYGDEQAYHNVWAMLWNITVPGTPWRTVTVKDSNDTSIIVPVSTTPLAPIGAEAFIFKTFGAQAECRVLTTLCTGGPTRVANCSNIGYPQLPYLPFTNCTTVNSECLSSQVFGLVDGAIQQPPNNTALATPPNPTEFLVQLKFGDTCPVSVDYSRLYHLNTTSVDNCDMLYAACTATYYNVTAQYDPVLDGFSINQRIPSNPYFTSILWRNLIQGQLSNSRLTSAMQGAGIMADDEVVAPLLSQEFSRMAIGTAGGVFTTAPADFVWHVSNAVLGEYPVAPVIAEVIILYIYSLFAIFIFISSCASSSYTVDINQGNSRIRVEKRAIVLGQMWLTNSLPLIGYAFGEEGRRTVAEDSLDMVRDVDAERLDLGVRETDGGPAFGLRRRGLGAGVGDSREESTLFSGSDDTIAE